MSDSIQEQSISHWRPDNVPPHLSSWLNSQSQLPPPNLFLACSNHGFNKPWLTAVCEEVAGDWLILTFWLADVRAGDMCLHRHTCTDTLKRTRVHRKWSLNSSKSTRFTLLASVFASLCQRQQWCNVPRDILKQPLLQTLSRRNTFGKTDGAQISACFFNSATLHAGTVVGERKQMCPSKI